MNRDQAREQIRQSAGQYLKPAKKRGTYICPLCGNGTGSTGDGMTTKDKVHFTCWKCHDIQNNDIIDIIGKEYGLAEYNDAFLKACDIFNIEPTNDYNPGATKPTTEEPKKEVIKTDYTQYINEAVRALNESKEGKEYLHKRGLTDATIDKFKLGYHNGNIVIPYNANCTYYIERPIQEQKAKYIKPKSDEAGAEPLYNGTVLKGASSPIFIVEGVFCAITIEQAGGVAVSLNTSSPTRALEDKLEELKNDFKGVFVLCLDNDEAGQTGQQKLVNVLDNMGLPYLEANIAGKYKDPNDRLQNDATGLYEAIKSAQGQANDIKEKTARGDSIALYAKEGLHADIARFIAGRTKSTGFKELDSASNGLYAGLYVIGAISSLGKTTFVHQLADQLAQGGEDVLFFSLEQSKLELVSKSIARELYKHNQKSNISSLDVRLGKINAECQEALDYYKSIGNRFSVIEGNFDCTIEYISDYVKKYIQATKASPIIVVDYLQIIQGDPRRDNKTNVETNIVGLKRLSRSYNIPVICISNINRANYLTPIDFESFKETGLIEYSADVVWGMQLNKITSPEFCKLDKDITGKRKMIDDEMKKSPRNVKLTCIKNRYGKRYSIDFEYFPRYDFIKELTTDFEPINEQDSSFLQGAPDWVKE